MLSFARKILSQISFFFADLLLLHLFENFLLFMSVLLTANPTHALMCWKYNVPVGWSCEIVCCTAGNAPFLLVEQQSQSLGWIHGVCFDRDDGKQCGEVSVRKGERRGGGGRRGSEMVMASEWPLLILYIQRGVCECVCVILLVAPCGASGYFLCDFDIENIYFIEWEWAVILIEWLDDFDFAVEFEGHMLFVFFYLNMSLGELNVCRDRTDAIK